MKLYAHLRLKADLENPLNDGVAFDTLVDGDPEQDEPIVQKVTTDDGSFEPDATQDLLIDDLPI